MLARKTSVNPMTPSRNLQQFYFSANREKLSSSIGIEVRPVQISSETSFPVMGPKHNTMSTMTCGHHEPFDLIDVTQNREVIVCEGEEVGKSSNHMDLPERRKQSCHLFRNGDRFLIARPFVVSHESPGGAKEKIPEAV